VLAHVSSSGSYQYDPNRFAMLDRAVGQCGKDAYPRLVANQVLSYGMTFSVPGRDAVTAPNASLFSASALAAYNNVLQRLALPYRVDAASKRATRTDYASPALSASTGLISSAHDLAKFDAALGDGFVSPELLSQAWQPAAGRPTGLGWFVQSYNGGKDTLVWHFGVAKDAYSSMILKVPNRRLTLILLANSDGLATSLSTSQPDVTQSIFARLFLKLFVS
jgi:CubicO group peptidase (beta-lactamase class C family)